MSSLSGGAAATVRMTLSMGIYLEMDVDNAKLQTDPLSEFQGPLPAGNVSSL